MKYNHVEGIGKISKLGFGAMRFPMKDGVIDQEQVNEMIKISYEAGVNYFDTAYVYNDGNSEIALGKALKQFPRESYYLVDKFPYYNLKTMEERDVFFQQSLDRCDVDYFDFYLVHAINADDFPKIAEFDVVNWALEKKRQGKIRHLGFSIHDTKDLLCKLLELCDWEFVQIQYNYMDLDHEPGKLGYDELVRREIPIVIMEPLKGGMLADIPEKMAEPFKLLGGSNVSYSFRWLEGQKGIMTVLSGMSNIEQTKENCEIYSNIEVLNAQEHKAVLQVEENIKSLQKVGCTGCRYCMPCPVGIDIPAAFKAWNTEAMNPTTNWISGTFIDYEEIEKCIACGNCTSQCPQKIEVPTMFTKILSEKRER